MKTIMKQISRSVPFFLLVILCALCLLVPAHAAETKSGIEAEIQEVWITKTGKCYHFKKDCVANPIAIDPVTAAKKYRPCSKCVGKNDALSVPVKEESSAILSAVQEPMVWIPTNGGKRYHSSEDCSNMIDPEHVTVSEAIARGFTDCGRCHPYVPPKP